MKNAISILCIFALSTLFVSGQFPSNTSEKFFIKGKVINTTSKIIEFGQTDFLNNIGQQININKDGTFNQSFKVNAFQNIYLYVNNNVVTFFIQPNDTILVEWDNKDFAKTFKISSPSPSRNKELQLNLLLYNEFRKPRMELSKKLGQNRSSPDSLRFSWINDMYNQELSTILGETPLLTKNTEKFVIESYYYYSRILMSNRLLPKYPLVSDISKANPNNSNLVTGFIPKPNYVKELFDKKFYESPDFRDFLYDYVRFGGELFNSFRTSNYSQKTDLAPFAPGMKDYYNGLANINIYPIRDWFITKVIFNSFSTYTFNESETALIDFLPKCKTQFYKDTLISFYAMVKKFKSGNLAPDFTLKDENDKSVSLNDFRGKLVYIDFWGVGCGPCRYQIANYVPKHHERYKEKDVVFVNICIDSDEKTWIKTLKVIKLDGINLIAEGWNKNPVCKDYNIEAIPHYILIDKEGRFVNSNMASPDAILSGQNKEIDNLLNIK